MTGAPSGGGDSSKRRTAKWLLSCLLVLLVVLIWYATRASRYPDVPPEDWQIARMADPRTRTATSIVIQQVADNSKRFIAFYCRDSDNPVIARIGLDLFLPDGPDEFSVKVDGQPIDGMWRAGEGTMIVADSPTSVSLLRAARSGQWVEVTASRAGGEPHSIAFGVSRLGPLLRSSPGTCAIE